MISVRGLPLDCPLARNPPRANKDHDPPPDGARRVESRAVGISQWTSVLGEKANASAAATAGFQQAIANLGSVGFSFGGGCSYGHGVRVSGGGARFAVTSYAVK